MNEPEIASRRRRIFAFMLDHIIMCVLASTGVFLALGKNWDTADVSKTMSLMTPVMIIVFIVYFLKDSFWGMSPGRYVLGIAVRDKEERIKCPNIFRLALRNIFIVIWPIEFLVLAFNKNKRRIGDYIAKTVVIRRSDIPTKNRAFALVGLVLFIGFIFVFSTSTMIKNSSAFEQATEHIRTDPMVIEEAGEVVGFGHFPTGGIQIQNQYGQAFLNLKVKGTKKNIPVNVIMEKQPDTEWTLKQLEITE